MEGSPEWDGGWAGGDEPAALDELFAEAYDRLRDLIVLVAVVQTDRLRGVAESRTIFVEPMFTSAFLENRPDVSARIPQPGAVAEGGYYPTRYVIRHDPVEEGFRISLEDFHWREAR